MPLILARRPNFGNWTEPEGAEADILEFSLVPYLFSQNKRDT
jgi:hypothetical protein